jgi:hypothetical protein
VCLHTPIAVSLRAFYAFRILALAGFQYRQEIRYIFTKPLTLFTPGDIVAPNMLTLAHRTNVLTAAATNPTRSLGRWNTSGIA